MVEFYSRRTIKYNSFDFQACHNNGKWPIKMKGYLILDGNNCVSTIEQLQCETCETRRAHACTAI